MREVGGLQVLFEQLRQMWLSRGACVKLMNRQREVNAAVRKYKAADKEFAAALGNMKADCDAVGVTAGFDYLSGFLSLQTICYMEVIDHFIRDSPLHSLLLSIICTFAGNVSIRCRASIECWVLQDHLIQLSKLTRKESTRVLQVKICADLVTHFHS